MALNLREYVKHNTQIQLILILRREECEWRDVRWFQVRPHTFFYNFIRDKSKF